MADLAERIREAGNKSVRQQRNAKHSDLQAEKQKNRELRDELAELRVTLAKVVTENATLLLQNQRLEAINSSENVSIMTVKKEKK